MSSYRIELRPAARRALGKLDPKIQLRVRGAIALLGQDPRPPASRRLRGRPEYRVRVGDYRIIYSIEDGLLPVIVIVIAIVIVKMVGHRREVYER